MEVLQIFVITIIFIGVGSFSHWRAVLSNEVHAFFQSPMSTMLIWETENNLSLDTGLLNELIIIFAFPSSLHSLFKHANYSMPLLFQIIEVTIKSKICAVYSNRIKMFVVRTNDRGFVGKVYNYIGWIGWNMPTMVISDIQKNSGADTVTFALVWCVSVMYGNSITIHADHLILIRIEIDSISTCGAIQNINYSKIIKDIHIVVCCTTVRFRMYYITHTHCIAYTHFIFCTYASNKYNFFLAHTLKFVFLRDNFIFVSVFHRVPFARAFPLRARQRIAFASHFIAHKLSVCEFS